MGETTLVDEGAVGRSRVVEMVGREVWALQALPDAWEDIISGGSVKEGAGLGAGSLKASRWKDDDGVAGSGRTLKDLMEDMEER